MSFLNCSSKASGRNSCSRKSGNPKWSILHQNKIISKVWHLCLTAAFQISYEFTYITSCARLWITFQAQQSLRGRAIAQDPKGCLRKWIHLALLDQLLACASLKPATQNTACSRQHPHNFRCQKFWGLCCSIASQFASDESGLLFTILSSPCWDLVCSPEARHWRWSCSIRHHHDRAQQCDYQVWIDKPAPNRKMVRTACLPEAVQ